ncbi:TetR family transcriptional regulator [Streptomyces sp. P6-2-1]|uniref:TetR family transcriptional regulator n=1 Tax=Streptomyces sp. P6-2-1 TaxID=3422591 RepID=UPI003D36FE52
MSPRTPRSAGSERGPSTREKLIRAAEEVFAEQGVHGAQLRDVVRLAGQGNPSAVQYHFGSRQGLLDAVMAARQERTERVLAGLVETEGSPGATAPGEETAPDEDSVPATARRLLTALVRAEASELGSTRGLRGLRISAQLSHESGVRTGVPHPTLDGTAYWRLIVRLGDCLPALPRPLRLERTDLVLTLIGAALADRARQYLAGTTPLTDEELFLADLVGTSLAVLTAPAPGPTT